MDSDGPEQPEGPRPSPHFDDDAEDRWGGDFDDVDNRNSGAEAIPAQLLSACQRARTQYIQAFSSTRRGPSEHSADELRRSIFRCVALIELLDDCGVTNSSFGLRKELSEQLDILNELRVVQLRLHGAEAFVSSFPELDSFREAQFNQQVTAVQDTLRRLGKIKTSKIERRFSHLESAVQDAEPRPSWPRRIGKKVDKACTALWDSARVLQSGDRRSVERFRAAFQRYRSLTGSLDLFVVSTGDSAGQAARAVERTLGRLDEIDAVIDGLSERQTKGAAAESPELAGLTSARVKVLEELSEAALRLSENPPAITIDTTSSEDDIPDSGARVLYVLRHGEAVTAGTPGFENDRDRPLTPKGIRLTKKAAIGMRGIGIRFERILTSPLVRARDTAQLVAEGTRFAGDVEETDALAPDAAPQALFEVLNDVFGRAKNAVIVGHQPDLGSLISILTSGDLNLSIDIKKGSICKIAVHGDVERACGTLEWLLTSKQLAEIG